MNLVDELIEAALAAVDPRSTVAGALRGQRRAHVLAIGKAAPPMFLGAQDAMGDRIVNALVVSKHPAELDVEVVLGDHPVPGPGSLRAAQRVMEFVTEVARGEHLIVLLSGGASSLLTAPAGELDLDQIAEVTTALLRGSASIEELNTVRRAMDVLKGGGLAARCQGEISTFVLSDVLGDPLEAIGSGPTAPNPTSHVDAMAILERFDVHLDLPRVEPIEVREVSHTVLANCRTALEAAHQRARTSGLHAQIISDRLCGEAREAGVWFARQLAEYDGPVPACLLAGGETTVTVQGAGRGGPSLELALAAVKPVQQVDATIVTLATDGEDGPTDAAGARVDRETFDRGIALGLDVSKCLEHNDAYSYFELLGDLIVTGPTGTNVNDLVFGFLGVE